METKHPLFHDELPLLAHSLQVRGLPRDMRRELYFVAKRILDVVVAAVLLIVLVPIIFLVAVIIKLDSCGSVIFRQERIGARRIVEGGREWWERKSFTILKFRTMRRDADPELHKSFVTAFINNDKKRMALLQGDDGVRLKKLVRDPRVTRVGKWLRKSSLDELPQFWNVLMGEMSLVGPRPPIPYEVEQYGLWHLRRLGTKPGLTGLWQVTARSSSDFDEMVALDIRYVREQSFWLDLVILAKTPIEVLRSRGAV